jgi:perosamine synthetase
MSDNAHSKQHIPVSKASMPRASLLAMNEVRVTGRLAAGPMVEEFEQAWADYLNLDARKMVAMSSGTAALEAVMHYIADERERHGWCAIVSPLGFFSTVSAIVRAGGIPIFADVDEHGNLDPTSVKRLLNHHPDTAAIVVTHWLGQPAKVDALKMLASNEEEVFLVEDCAQAHGALLDGQHMGSFGDFAIWSFYATKHITTAGEGGAAYSSIPHAADWLRKYRSHGMSSADTHDFIGTNARMTEIAAACGIPQIHRLDVDIVARIRVATQYRERLQHVPHVHFHHVEPATRHAFFWMPMRISRELMTGARFKRHIAQDGVEVRCRYSNCFYSQPALGLERGLEVAQLRAEDLAGQVVGLPYFDGIDLDTVDRVVTCVNRVVQDELRARHTAREVAS